MEIEVDDGVTVYAKIMKVKEFDINLVVRAGGSISIYGTVPTRCVHLILFDTLDNEPPREKVKPILDELFKFIELGDLLKTVKSYRLKVENI